ncbi:MAG: DUF3426 domain-containing protein [Rubrivivax sp.]|nr:MAG: DUF3426 domain-containing protein [Rubrivivax sp.]
MWLPPPALEPRVDALPTGWPGDELRQEPRWVDDEPPAHVNEPLPAPPPLATLPAPVEASGPVVPEFMRAAQESARWNRPAVRTLLAVGSLLLAVALLLQVTLHFRDALSALHPPLKGPLQGLCSAFGCEVKPWRRIEALKIDSTTLSPVGSGNSYKLALTLANRANVAVAAPWIELKLTDASGAPLARRVFGPEALNPHLQQVPALSDQTLTLTFRTPGQAVSGYVVEAFYP